MVLRPIPGYSSIAPTEPLRITTAGTTSGRESERKKSIFGTLGRMFKKPSTTSADETYGPRSDPTALGQNAQPATSVAWSHQFPNSVTMESRFHPHLHSHNPYYTHPFYPHQYNPKLLTQHSRMSYTGKFPSQSSDFWPTEIAPSYGGLIDYSSHHMHSMGQHLQDGPSRYSPRPVSQHQFLTTNRQTCNRIPDGIPGATEAAITGAGVDSGVGGSVDPRCMEEVSQLHGENMSAEKAEGSHNFQSFILFKFWLCFVYCAHFTGVYRRLNLVTLHSVYLLRDKAYSLVDCQ